ncbi:hypothetical protein RBU60_03760 [Mesonia sp. MT50]|uniref:Uncharacterized protein n=1 Tax=Mesonia profundi TaxID=3070998 RepID=A0ABU0ZYZ1_9FLAO|nr:hypothetical protein [Mesonia profundi]MDQ7916680.1 hypothetical protein [Mesonia profundi]
MKQYVWIFSVLIIFFSACSEDDTAPNNEPIQSLEDFDLVGNFIGNMSAGNLNNSLEGSIIVDNNSFKIITFGGEISGTAELNGGNYILNNLTSTGVFEGSTNVSGLINTDNQDLSIDGVFIDDSDLIVEGTYTQEESSQAFSDARSKSMVIFQSEFEESCDATITIDGETIGPLGGFYQPVGYCASNSLPNIAPYPNVDSQDSYLDCREFVLRNPDTGEYNTYEFCPFANFILDKNTAYNYSVAWENGEFSKGSFTTKDGGLGLVVCLDNPGEACDGDGGGEDGEPAILVNTITIDPNRSNTSDNLTLSFVNTVYYSDNSPPSIGFGDTNEGTRLFFSPLTEFSEQIYNLPDESVNGPLYALTINQELDNEYDNLFELNENHHMSTSKGQIEVVEFDLQARIIELRFNDVVAQRNGFDSLDDYITFSGTIRARF